MSAFSPETNALGVIRNNASSYYAWIIGGALSFQGTSAGVTNDSYVWDEGTRTGVAAVTVSKAIGELSNLSGGIDKAIMELRRISGLTWDQIARIFDVNRRSVHFWASGKPMTQSHEEKLYAVLDVIRRIDKGTASENRSSLLKIDTNGFSALDMLKNGDFASVIDSIGVSTSPRKTLAQLSSSEFERRKIPVSPGQLLDARQETVHEEVAPRKRVLASQIRKR